MPKTTPPELVEKIRQYAERGDNATVAAAELTTPECPLTRSAVLGMASRRGIRFAGKSLNPGRKRKPKQPKPRVTAPTLRPSFAVQRTAAIVKAPASRCSWSCCTRDVEYGNMFCHGHGRMALT